MNVNIDLMTGQPTTGPDQLITSARNEFQRMGASVLAAAAFCIGSTLSPGVASPRAESVTVMAIEVPAVMPTQRTPAKVLKSTRTNAMRAY